MTWNAAVPAGTDNIRDGDNVIRELKTDIATALSAYGRFPISAGAPKFQYLGEMGATGSRPTNGEGGIYFDTTINAIMRDNGVTWDRVGINFAATTALPFYQVSAPLGWTKSVAENDKFFRVVSGSSGGSSGGTFTNFNHTHTGPSHTHTGTAATHSHGLSNGAAMLAIDGSDDIRLKEATTNNWTSDGQATAGSLGGAVAFTKGVQLDGTTDASGSLSLTINADGTGSTSPATLTHGSAQHAYVDFIICTKD